MNNSSKTIAVIAETRESFICGCMTFGALMFITTAILFLSQNSTAQAFITATVQ